MQLAKRPDQLSIGIVQWETRLFDDWEQFFRYTESQVRALSSCQVILFPEYFNVSLVQLQAEANKDERRGLEWLGKHAERVATHFSQLAQHYRVDILAGSIPEWTNSQQLFNTAYYCHSDGRVDSYRKMHLTPYEAEVWKMGRGNQPGLVEASFGKVGVCICYDIEFPELARLYRRAGALLLLVPFSTDTEFGFERVHACARARAIENECIVAIAGNVGNLPEVPQLEFQFARSGVFTPSDFGLPYRGTAAQAPPGIAAAFPVIVHPKLVERLHEHGTVRNLRDRRTDLYDVKWQNRSG